MSPGSFAAIAAANLLSAPLEERFSVARMWDDRRQKVRPGPGPAAEPPMPADAPYKLKQRRVGMRQTRILHSHHIRAYAQKTGITAISKAELDAVFK